MYSKKYNLYEFRGQIKVIENLPKNILFSILLECNIKTCLNLTIKYRDFPKHDQ